MQVDVVRFNCRHCGKRFKSPLAHIGHVITCSSCGGKMTVPQPPLPNPPQPPPPAPPPPPKKRPRVEEDSDDFEPIRTRPVNRGGWSAITFQGVCVIVAIGVGSLLNLIAGFCSTRAEQSMTNEQLGVVLRGGEHPKEYTRLKDISDVFGLGGYGLLIIAACSAVALWAYHGNKRGVGLIRASILIALAALFFSFCGHLTTATPKTYRHPGWN